MAEENKNTDQQIITKINEIPIGITDFSNISGTIVDENESSKTITLQDAIDLLMKMAKFFDYFKEEQENS